MAESGDAGLVTLAARAKINVCLDVLERRADGYHNVDMVLQSIALADRVDIEPWSSIELEGDLGGTPAGSDNLALRAARLLAERAGCPLGARITLRKTIPVAAGLAGGSADAAAVLSGLNHLWGLEIPDSELEVLGASLGSDVPFCIRGGAARATGTGTVLEFANGSPTFLVALFCPAIPVSTAEVYHGLELNGMTVHPNVGQVWHSWATSDLGAVQAVFGNVLESVTLRMHPDLARYKREMSAAGGAPVLMSGSGPSLFCIVPTMDAARRVLDVTRSWPGRSFLTHTVSRGISPWR